MSIISNNKFGKTLFIAKRSVKQIEFSAGLAD